MKSLHPRQHNRGRPISFSKDALIDDVTELFWTHGYNSLSLNIIAKEMGLKRSSLYNAFKTKEGLFLKCLDRYRAQSPASCINTYTRGENVGSLLHQTFEKICKVRAHDPKKRGCMALNAYNELANTPSDLAEILRHNHDIRQQKMNEIITCAIQQKELPQDSNAKVISNIILSFMSGINIHAKRGATEQELLDMSHVFLDKIGFPTTPASIQ